MAVSANFGGKTYSFPDGTTDDQIYQYLNQNVSPQMGGENGVAVQAQDKALDAQAQALGQQSQDPSQSNYQTRQDQSQDQGWGFGEGGFMGALKAGGEALLANTRHGYASLAAQQSQQEAANPQMFQNPEDAKKQSLQDAQASRYAARSAEQAASAATAEEAKLGTAGHLVSGAVQYAPAMAAGMVNPYLGAAAMGGATEEDILKQQYEQQGKYNDSQAELGGAVAAGLDLATGGLAGKLATPTSGLIRKGAAAVAHDVANAESYNTGTNVGMGRDLLENAGEAAVQGATAGLAMRGTMKGLSAAHGIKLNEGGQQAIAKVQQVEQMGNKVSPRIRDNTEEYHNLQGDFQQRQKNGDVDDHDIAGATSLAVNGGGDAALTDAYVGMADAGVPMTKAALDFNYTPDLGGANKDVRHAAEELGSSKREAMETLSKNMEARPSYGERGQQARENGLTWQTHAAKVQEAGQRHLNTMLGHFDTNISYIERQIREGEMNGETRDRLRQYGELGKSLRALKSIANNYGSTNKANMARVLEDESENAMRLANQLGESQNLVNFQGKTGGYNPAHDVRVVDMTENMLRSEYPSFHSGTPTATIEKPGIPTHGLTPGEFAMGLTMTPLAPVAKRIIKLGREELSARKSSKTMAANIESTKAAAQEFAGLRNPKPAAEAKMNEGLAKGDVTGAATGAEEGLNASGIQVPEGVEHPIQAPEAMPEETVQSADAEAQTEEPVAGTVTPETAPREKLPTQAPAQAEKPFNHETDLPKTFNSESVKPQHVDMAKETGSYGQQINKVGKEGSGTVVGETKTQYLVHDGNVIRKVSKVSGNAMNTGGRSRWDTELPTNAPRRPMEEPTPEPEPTPAPAEEAPQEAPAQPEAAPEPQGPTAQELVTAERAKLKQRAQETEAIAAKSPDKAPKLAASRAKLEYNMYERMHARNKAHYSEEEIHNAIQDLGGISEMGKRFGVEDEARMQEALKAQLSENRTNAKIKAQKEAEATAEENRKKGEAAAKEAAAKMSKSAAVRAEKDFRDIEGVAKTPKDIIDEAVHFATEEGGFNKRRATAVVRQRLKELSEGKEKGEIKPAAVEAPANDKATEYNEKVDHFRRLQEAKGTPDDMIDEAIKAGSKDGVFSSVIANAHASTAQRLEKARQKPTTNIMETRQTLLKFAREVVGPKANKEVSDMINNATREVEGMENKGLSTSQTRGLMNKVVNILDKQRQAAEVAASNEKKALDAAKGKKDADKIQERLDKANEKVKELTSKVTEAKAKAEDYKRQLDESVRLGEKAGDIDAALRKMEELERNHAATLEAKIKDAQKAFSETFKGMPEEQVDTALRHVAKEAVEGDLPIEHAIGAIKYAVKESDRPEYKDFYEALGTTLETAVEHKAKYPNNPETWLSREDFDALKKSKFGNEDASYAGSLGVNLINKIFGRHKAVVENVTNLKNRDEIEAIIEDVTSGKAEVKAKAAHTKSAISNFKAKANAKRKGQLFVG